jgi:hypothetical protein
LSTLGSFVGGEAFDVVLGGIDLLPIHARRIKHQLASGDFDGGPIDRRLCFEAVKQMNMVVKDTEASDRDGEQRVRLMHSLFAPYFAIEEMVLGQ